MKIVVAGLGRMGSQIARKLVQDGHEVYAHNRSPEPIDRAVKDGAKPAYEKSDALTAFEAEQFILWLMVPSDVIDTQLDEWLKIVPKGSLIVDGGNSNYQLTKQRAAKVAARGSLLTDVGTSGGILGLKNGFSMMVGGDGKSFQVIEPILKSLSKPRGGYQYFGSPGSGHYVKMVHNAIEYGMMESLAEGYRMLKEGPYKALDLAKAGEVWQLASVIESTLNKLSKDALSENPELEGINGVVAETGETRWTLETAKELKVDLPAIKSSFDVRLASQRGQTNFATKLLAAMRAKFGGHDINPN